MDTETRIVRIVRDPPALEFGWWKQVQSRKRFQVLVHRDMPDLSTARARKVDFEVEMLTSPPVDEVVKKHWPQGRKTPKSQVISLSALAESEQHVGAIIEFQIGRRYRVTAIDWKHKRAWIEAVKEGDSHV